MINLGKNTFRAKKPVVLDCNIYNDVQKLKYNDA